MTTLLEALGQIPGEIYGAAIGAIIALGGVALSARAERTRLELQLADAAMQRQYELRKLVFLELSSALVAMSRFITYCAVLDAELPDVQQHQAALQRIPLVCAPDTHKAFVAVDCKFHEATSLLLRDRFHLLAAASRLRTLQAEVSCARAQGNDCSALELEESRVFSTHDAAVRAHLRSTMERALEFEQSAVELLVAARTELGFPTDAEAFRSLAAQQLAEARKALGSILDNLPQSASAAPA